LHRGILLTKGINYEEIVCSRSPGVCAYFCIRAIAQHDAGNSCSAIHRGSAKFFAKLHGSCATSPPQRRAPSPSSSYNEKDATIKSAFKNKLGSLAAPQFALFAVPVLSAADFAHIPGRPAPRARCAQLLFSSKPGGFILCISGAKMSSRSFATPLQRRMQAKRRRNHRFLFPIRFLWKSYLMNSVSRS